VIRDVVKIQTLANPKMALRRLMRLFSSPEPQKITIKPVGNALRGYKGVGERGKTQP
jgi:hypothetical protein